MIILVDTSVWTVVFRRRFEQLGPEQRVYAAFLRQLIDLDLAGMIGPIRQEILSGIRDEASFDKLRTKLEVFDDIPIYRRDYEKAAWGLNHCQRAGISGGDIDLLFCAVAIRLNAPILTLDRDFLKFRDLIGVILYEPH